ncbi:hypothetical protein A2875_01650 [Candidatus Gottesmanbacteria bacterium RIFCSPHIGHO2_01_FULL_46_14]|uniref:AbiEi antitoxin C-terminal domain-containing protein n=1 Tax=Candidatus Gottesmanbacteria bacterium RIFCSPHIGHO2_01_FULL_46_14 TaxID=1798380 RepID=A0A1F5ZK52_9BACT|nr:MAG: hypothetical protein A2875_01650 [Candidatus Gottesmanbacteria bacterium RIFCSPHIGHO2_01_FULL_46_14]
MQFLPYLLNLPQTVFTLNELELLFPQIPAPLLRKRAHYFVKTNKLLRPRAGIYTKIEFDWLELGNKIYYPSYISFQTVLQKAGMIFQPYETIYVASYLSRSLSISGQIFHYRKLKNDILLNHEGIVREKNYSIASKERAFLDTILFYKNYHIDNLNPLNWELVNQMVKIYSNKTLEKRVHEYYKIFTSNA